MLTGPQAEALRAVAAITSTSERGRYGWCSARQVALALWPNSGAWDRPTRRRDGRSGTYGGTMPMKAARLLHALERRGLVQVRHGRATRFALTLTGYMMVHPLAEPRLRLIGDDLDVEMLPGMTIERTTP